MDSFTLKLQEVHNKPIHTLLFQNQGYLINTILNILLFDNLFFFYIAKKGYLTLQLFFHRSFSAAHNNIRLNTDLS